MSLKGIFTAIVTPFKDPAHRGIDQECFAQLLDRQVEAGVDGVVVAGSTGEGPTLYEEEWENLVETAVSYKDRLHIMASCGSSSSWQTEQKIVKAKELGVHSFLVASPAYNKPPQHALVSHFKKMAEVAAPKALMIYNIPGRTAVNITPETFEELWQIPNIQAVKESSGNWSQFLKMRSQLPSEKYLLSGEDPLNLAFFTHGAHGSVSVLSNIAPRALVEIWQACQKQEWEKAQKIFFQCLPMVEKLFCESNPIPVKWAVSQVIDKPLTPRPPLTPLSETNQKTILDELKNLRSHGFLES